VAIFTAIATALLAGTFLAGSTFAIGALAVGLGVATEIGLSYALKAMAGEPAQQDAAQGFGVQGTLNSGGDVPRSFNLGYSITAGSLVYANTWGNVGQTPNAYLTQVIALEDLPRGRLVEVWINSELCTLGPVVDSNLGAPVTQYSKDGADHLWIKYYNGTQTAADPLLVSTVASVDRPYPGTRVGTGVSYAICTSLVEDTLFTGFPTFKFGVSGIPLYDPSKDDTAGGSGSQRHSDPATWGGDGDNLPAVQIYNILRGFYYGGTWLYGLQNMAAARLPAANWIAQIAKCRAAIAGTSGDEPTYRAGGQININVPAANAVEAFLTACQGRLSEIGGFYKIHLGTPDSTSFAFTDQDILSTEQQVFKPFFALADSVNGIQGKYPDPAQGWSTATAPPFYRTDLETRDGGRRLMASPSFDMVPYPAQVQRLQKSAIEEGQRARTHTIVLPPAFWPAEPGDVCSWSSERNGYELKLFRIDGAVDKANLDLAVNITEVDPADYDWNHSIDFKPVTTGPTIFPRPAPQGIVDWNVVGAIIYDADRIGRRAGLDLTWDGTLPGIAGVQYEVRNAGDHVVIGRGRTDQLAAGSLLISQSLIPNTAYQVRGQYLPSAPRDMLWSDWLDVTTPDVRLTLIEFDEALHAQVTSIQDSLNDKIDALTQLISGVVANQDARNWTDKREVRSQLSARSDAAFAEIDNLQTVMVSADTALASDISTISAGLASTDAGLAGAEATITINATAIATLNGYAGASYSVTLDVNHNVVGTTLVNGGPGTSAFNVLVDKFQIAAPGVGGGAAVPIFTTGNVGGVPKVGIRADMYIDGSITATMMSVGSLSAINANMGSITAGTIQSTDGKFLIDCTNKRIVISD
jgi:putative tail protein